jgi:hypothetical protein
MEDEIKKELASFKPSITSLLDLDRRGVHVGPIKYFKDLERVRDFIQLL